MQQWTIIDASEPIHLLLTDIVMPGEMDGRDLARAAVARRPLLRTLLTSGFPDARWSGSGTHQPPPAEQAVPQGGTATRGA